jgi:hypothetical protein
MSVTIKNTTNTIVTLNDISISLAPNDSLDLSSIVPLYEGYSSQDLKDKVNDGIIVINDGDNDLIINDALNFLSKAGISNESPISVSFGGKPAGDHYWEFKKTTFYIGRKIYFAGYEKPTLMKIIGSISDDSYLATVQLYDITHDELISLVEFNNESPTIITGTLENIPTEESILEIRGKVSRNNTRAYLYYFSLI